MTFKEFLIGRPEPNETWYDYFVYFAEAYAEMKVKEATKCGVCGSNDLVCGKAWKEERENLLKTIEFHNKWAKDIAKELGCADAAQYRNDAIDVIKKKDLEIKRLKDNLPSEEEISEIIKGCLQDEKHEKTINEKIKPSGIYYDKSPYVMAKAIADRLGRGGMKQCLTAEEN